MKEKDYVWRVKEMSKNNTNKTCIVYSYSLTSNLVTHTLRKENDENHTEYNICFIGMQRF